MSQDQRFVERGMAWVNRLRLRAVVLTIGIPLAAFGVISLGPGWLALPIVGVAVAAVTVSLSRLAEKMVRPVCLCCGQELKGLPAYEHGIICPRCGSLHQLNPELMERGGRRES